MWQATINEQSVMNHESTVSKNFGKNLLTILFLLILCLIVFLFVINATYCFYFLSFLSFQILHPLVLLVTEKGKHLLKTAM